MCERTGTEMKKGREDGNETDVGDEDECGFNGVKKLTCKIILFIGTLWDIQTLSWSECGRELIVIQWKGGVILWFNGRVDLHFKV